MNFVYGIQNEAIIFDNPEALQKQMAIRSFESSFQAMSKNVAGNPTMAIRLKGNEKNKHIAFLPILDKVTGSSVGFTKVEKITFSYYLTEESDDFDSASLFLTTMRRDDILLDTAAYSNLKKESWQKAEINIADLNLNQVKGENSVLPNVYELRFDINYHPGKKNIEMRRDDFGWE